MIDVETRKPVVVNSGGTGGPYIMIPLDQLQTVESMLRAHNVYHWTDTDSISLDGKPAIIVVNLGREGNAALAQQLLDSVS
jgi:hypothetical protein